VSTGSTESRGSTGSTESRGSTGSTGPAESTRPVVQQDGSSARSGTDQAGSESWALPRGIIVLLGLGGAVLAGAGLRSVRDLAAPLFLALTLTIAVSPLRRLLVRRGAPRWVATIVALAAVYIIVFGLAASIAFSLARLATLLPTYQDDFNNLVDNARSWLADRGISAVDINAALSRLNLGDLLNVLRGWLHGLLGAFSNLAFVVVALFFMGIDGAQFPQRIRVMSRQRPEIAQGLSGFARGTVRYLIVSTIFGLIVAAFDVAVLYILGIPLPLLWGLLAFITNYVPNVGFVIGVIPPAILGLLDGGLSTMLWVIAAYCVINFIIQSIIQPKVVGDVVGLSTTLTFVSLVFWAWVLGPLGAVLAIPMSLLVKGLLVDIDPSTRWLDALLAGGDVSDEPDRSTELPAKSTPAAPAADISKQAATEAATEG
jgi:AI-2 transport protein TqsA